MVLRLPRNWLYALTGALSATTFLLLAWSLFGDGPTPRPSFTMTEKVLDKACVGFQNLFHSQISNLKDGSAGPSSPAIPNYVHYVWLLKDPSLFEIDFVFFLSAYSASTFLRPERIYIHTDASPQVFETARDTSPDRWTRRLLALPGLTPNYLTTAESTTGGVPNITTSGVTISRPEHKSDFIRLQALREYGGVYLDSDVIPLRDLRPLREAGFAAVVGGASSAHMRFQGYIGNGVMLSRPGSMLVQLYHSAAHRVFDGQWASASVHLLTDLAERLVPLPTREVLVMHPRAFTPSSWEYADQKALWAPKLQELPRGEPEDDSWEAVMTALDKKEKKMKTNNGKEGKGVLEGGGLADEDEAYCVNTAAWLISSERSMGRREKGEIDFSGSYVVHAFDGTREMMLGWDGMVDLEYILQRKSNFARAVYPAVWHAIRTNMIPPEEVP